MMKKEFDFIAKEQFKFLQLEYGFKLLNCEKEDWGYELIYQNITTGVKITYEFSEAYIFIMLYQLVDGNIKENPRNIENDTKLLGFGLDDLINLRSPQDLIKPAYEYGEASIYYNKHDGLLLYVSAFADNLKKYAKDILSGDFAVFPQLDQIVKERVEKYKQ